MFQNINKFANKKISKDDLREEIRLTQERGYPTENFMLMIYTIAYKVLRTKKFRKNTIDWIEDAASSSLIKFCESFEKFDLTKINKKGEPCSPYSFYMTSIKRAIYDTWRNDYYKFFDLKRSLIRYQSCLNPNNDICFDDIDKEDNSDDKDYIKDYEQTDDTIND